MIRKSDLQAAIFDLGNECFAMSVRLKEVEDRLAKLEAKPRTRRILKKGARKPGRPRKNA